MIMILTINLLNQSSNSQIKTIFFKFLIVTGEITFALMKLIRQMYIRINVYLD